jgi:hypothetical protein
MFSMVKENWPRHRRAFSATFHRLSTRRPLLYAVEVQEGRLWGLEVLQKSKVYEINHDLVLKFKI